MHARNVGSAGVCDPTTRNDYLQMRVSVGPLAVVMQHRVEAELGIQPAVIAAEWLECLARRLERRVTNVVGARVIGRMSAMPGRPSSLHARLTM